MVNFEMKKCSESCFEFKDRTTGIKVVRYLGNQRRAFKMMLNLRKIELWLRQLIRVKEKHNA